jgi:hypothetical protein
LLPKRRFFWKAHVALGLGFLGEVEIRPKQQDWKTDGTDRDGFLPPAAVINKEEY